MCYSIDGLHIFNIAGGANVNINLITQHNNLLLLLIYKNIVI